MLVLVGVLSFLYMFGYHFPSQAQLEKTGLPPEPEVFVNREQEQFNIINSLTTSGPNHSRIVTVTGAPGHGKSALATVCGYTLHNMGIRIRHVDLERVCMIEDFIDGILDTLSSGTNQKRPTRINLMQRVKKVVNTVILILDNADCFTLSESQSDNFSSVINGVVRNSNGSVKIIITTQYNVLFMDCGLHVAIRNLTLQHSLQLFTRRNPNTSPEEALPLVLYTDGIPLALEILSLLLRIESLTVSELLEKLMSDPLESLSENNTEYGMKRIFTIATNYLSENDRMCFVLASLFPSSFTEHTATSVLTHFINDTGCLHRLQSRSLIEYSYRNRVKRYHVLSLLKQHGNDIRPDRIDMTEFQVLLTLHHMSHPLQSQTHQQWVLQEHLNTETHTVRYLMENFNVTRNSIATEGEMSIVVHFAVESFDLLPFHHPIHVVEAFWANIQDMCRETIQHSVSTGECQTNFPDCLKFHLKVAQVSIHSKRTHLLEGADFENLGDLQVGSLIEAGCVDMSTAIRLLVYISKYVETQGNTTTYQELLNTIQTLQNRTITQSDLEQVMEYDIGTILYELAEYYLAIEFLDACSITSKRSLKENVLLQFHMGQFLALLYTRVGKLTQAKLIADNTLHLLANVEIKRKTHHYLQLQFLLARIQYSLGNYSVALEILRNCSLTIAVSDLKLPILADPAGKELMKAYHDLIPSELQVVFDAMAVVKRTVLARISALKYRRSEELVLFIVLCVTLYVAMVGTVVSIIDGHYFVYQLYTSRSPMYKMYITTLYMGMPTERPFLSLIIWTSLPPLVKYLLFTVSTAVMGSVTYYVHWHLYYILYYFNFV